MTAPAFQFPPYDRFRRCAAVVTFASLTAAGDRLPVCHATATPLPPAGCFIPPRCVNRVRTRHFIRGAVRGSAALTLTPRSNTCAPRRRALQTAASYAPTPCCFGVPASCYLRPWFTTPPGSPPACSRTRRRRTAAARTNTHSRRCLLPVRRHLCRCCCRALLCHLAALPSACAHSRSPYSLSRICTSCFHAVLTAAAVTAPFCATAAAILRFFYLPPARDAIVLLIVPTTACCVCLSCVAAVSLMDGGHVVRSTTQWRFADCAVGWFDVGVCTAAARQCLVSFDITARCLAIFSPLQ